MSRDNDDFKSNFGDRLRTARKELGLNQTDFASMVGVARDTLSRYERGELSPSVEVLFSIVSALGPNMTADWLLGSGPMMNLDEDKTRIRIPNFGSLVGLKFGGAGIAQVSMGASEVQRIMQACIEFENSREKPNLSAINMFQELIEYFYEEEDVSALEILAEVVIAMHAARLSPVWPEYENERRERTKVIEEFNSTQNINGKGHTIAGRDVINNGKDK